MLLLIKTMSLIYARFVDLIRDILRDLKEQNLVFVGKFEKGKYKSGYVTDADDHVNPFRVMLFDEILSTPLAVQYLLGYAYNDAREGYLDDATR